MFTILNGKLKSKNHISCKNPKKSQSIDSECKFWMSPLLWHQTYESINIFQSQPPLKLFLKTPVPSQHRSRSHDLTCTSMTNIFTAKTSNSSFFGSRGICFNDLTGTVIETRPQQNQKTMAKNYLKRDQKDNSKKSFKPLIEEMCCLHWV